MGFVTRLTLILAALLPWSVIHSAAQTLNLPPRPVHAPTGSQFVRIVTAMPRAERENWILAQVLSGNVPAFQRTLVPITLSATLAGTPHTATFYATPDYLAIGTDADYFLQPATPLLGQRICNFLGCTLPTRKMVNQIWTSAAVKLAPQSIPPSAEMITVPVFSQHNDLVRTQRNAYTNSFRLGKLVAGDKKDVVLSSLIYTNLHTGVPKPVVIYGWHYQSGTPIQPLYNGHEETYADYSHGLRLVQNGAIVDGSEQNITNLLTTSLAGLFSDEGAAEGTTSDGVIKSPRYPISGLAPAILTHPRRQTVLPGSSPGFHLLLAGDSPLGYRWLRNGLAIPGATNADLVLSNAQTASAGSYSLVVTNPYGSATSRVALLQINTNVHPPLFADDLDLSTSAQWAVSWGASDGVPDYTVDWAYDYGTIPYTWNGVTSLIPPAPHSPDASTRAVRLTVNNNDATGATAAVNLYPLEHSFNGNFALKFDLWINYPGGAGGINSTGSTQYAIFGVNHLGTQPNWAAASATSSDGLWFAVDGEGGTAADYRAYAGNPSGAPTDLTPLGTSGLIASNQIAAIYQGLFPSADFETAGSPGKQWVEVEVRQTNHFILWLLNGSVIATRTNATGFTAGTVMLGMMDPFASIANPAKDAFVLFDNVRVENLDGPALQPPTIAAQPQNLNVQAGTNATFTVAANGSAPLSYQWRHGGTNLTGATGTAFVLTNIASGCAGNYDVLVSNEAGFAASATATLTLAVADIRFVSANLSQGQMQLELLGVPGSNYAMESSLNFSNWNIIGSVTASNGPVPFTDANPANDGRRYYRARQIVP